MKKRGMTLIELMVAMSIFVIVMTLAIGGYVSISRTRILMGNMKDSQQKVRIANEMIIRYARQAEYIKLANDGSSLELYFDVDTGETPSAKKFQRSRISNTDPYDLLFYECTDSSPVARACSNWGLGTSLLGGSSGNISLMNPETNPNIFQLDGVLPSVLKLKLMIASTVPGNSTLSDEMTIQNAIILESIK